MYFAVQVVFLNLCHLCNLWLPIPCLDPRPSTLGPRLPWSVQTPFLNPCHLWNLWLCIPCLAGTSWRAGQERERPDNREIHEIHERRREKILATDCTDFTDKKFFPGIHDSCGLLFALFVHSAASGSHLKSVFTCLPCRSFCAKAGVHLWLSIPCLDPRLSTLGPRLPWSVQTPFLNPCNLCNLWLSFPPRPLSAEPAAPPPGGKAVSSDTEPSVPPRPGQFPAARRRWPGPSPSSRH